jgi:serine/threonine protein kinase
MIGKTLGHYRVLATIGAGGMGVVYRARDERLDRDVALKVLPPGTLADEAARKRFRREALALSRLNHPSIATVHDFDSEDGVDFLVMELIPGVTLDQKPGPIPPPAAEVLRLGTQLAQGLAAAHEQGVVHRDLKPGNLRITPDGRLKILDFGLAMLERPQADSAAATATAVTQHGAVPGTLPYMAPEQLRGEGVDARTDIHAAGAVLYELATGRRPFPQAPGPVLAAAILNQVPTPPRAVNPELPPALEGLILKALDKDPSRRQQSARELLAELEGAAAGPRPDPLPGRAPPRGPEPRSGPGLLRRRHDRGAHHGSGEAGRAARHLAHLGHALQGRGAGAP